MKYHKHIKLLATAIFFRESKFKKTLFVRALNVKRSWEELRERKLN